MTENYTVELTNGTEGGLSSKIWVIIDLKKKWEPLRAL